MGTSSGRAVDDLDFICIGAQKAGTSWFDRVVRSHPDLWLPPLKELHYFDQKLPAGAQRIWANLRGRAPVNRRWRSDLRERLRDRFSGHLLSELGWDLRYFLRPPSDEWYLSLFRGARGRLCGEVTPDYSALPAPQVKHVHALLPEAKVLFFLRNPLERAWSQASMYVKRSGDAGGAMANLESDHSRTRTDYVAILRTWRSYYPDEQIFIGFLEDIHFRPDELLARIYRFLGVGEIQPQPQARERVHVGTSSMIPGQALARLLDLYGGLVDELDGMFGGHAAWWRYCRDRLAAEPTEPFPYPFYATQLWDDWIERQGDPNFVPPVQSASLAEVPVRP